GALHINMPEGSDGDVGDEDGEFGEALATFTRQGTPRFLDIDGDGRSEIVVWGGAGGDGRLVVFTIPKSGAAAEQGTVSAGRGSAAVRTFEDPCDLNEATWTAATVSQNTNPF